MGMPKEYSGTLKLGEGTPSLDAATEVDARLPWEQLSDEDLRRGAEALTGDIEQVGGWGAGLGFFKGAKRGCGGAIGWVNGQWEL